MLLVRRRDSYHVEVHLEMDVVGIIGATEPFVEVPLTEDTTMFNAYAAIAIAFDPRLKSNDLEYYLKLLLNSTFYDDADTTFEV